MFNLSGEKVLFVFIVALVVLGPDHLPVAMRRAGQIMAQLRDISDALQHEVAQAMDDPGEPIVKPISQPHLSAAPDVDPPMGDTPDEGASNPSSPVTDTLNET